MKRSIAGSTGCPAAWSISNLGACAIFAALTGSSPACCAAIGKMGIPEMRRRGYPDEVATGSICAGGTSEFSFRRRLPSSSTASPPRPRSGVCSSPASCRGIMLTGLFMLWSIFAIWRSGFRSHAVDFRYSWKEKFTSIPKIAPFIAIIVGVMYALYGGVATPSEAAGVGAGLCLVLAVVIYRLWRPDQIWDDSARHDAGIGDDPDHHRRLRTVRLHADVALSYPDAGPGHRRSARQQMGVDVPHQHLPPGLRFLHPAGRHYSDDVADPIADHHRAGFDPVWFGVILTINMEIGLIHPPVGLNIYIVNAIAPDVPIVKVMWGTLPYVICMMLAIVILCFFPQIATWLPNHLMGARK